MTPLTAPVALSLGDFFTTSRFTAIAAYVTAIRLKVSVFTARIVASRRSMKVYRVLLMAIARGLDLVFLALF